MDISAIMVHVDASHHTSSRLSHAVALAMAFRATLIGLLSEDIGGSAPTGPGALSCDISRHRFEAATDSASIAVDWRVGEGSAIESMHCEGRLADLIVVSQPEPSDGRRLVPSKHFVRATILDTGPPVLVVPLGANVSTDVWPYARILVAWTGTRESARALRDALPMLRNARSVDLVSCISPAQRRHEESSPPSYAVVWLARRGIKAALVRLQPGFASTTGKALLDTAAGRGADLLVCGVTAQKEAGALDGLAETILAESPVPTLFSH